MIYVTAIDKYLSGWGEAKGKLNKCIFECEEYATAERIEQKLKDRSEMKYVNICITKPRVKSYHYPSFFNKTDSEYWYR